MLSRALSAGYSPDWVLADEVYGSDRKFRRFLAGGLGKSGRSALEHRMLF